MKFKFKTEYLLGIIPIAAYLLKNDKLIKVGGKFVQGSYKKVLYYRKLTAFYGSVYDVPNEILLSIIATESMGINHTKKGSSDELGIMQITPLGLQYVDTLYTIDQMTIPLKAIEVGSRHLYKDYQLFRDWNYAIMSYNIDREHIKNVLDNSDGKKYTLKESKYKVNNAGRIYLGKVTKNKKVLTPMLLQPNIDDPSHIDYIPFETL